MAGWYLLLMDLWQCNDICVCFFLFQTALLGGATALELAQLLRNQWAQFLRGSQ